MGDASIYEFKDKTGEDAHSERGGGDRLALRKPEDVHQMEATSPKDLLISPEENHFHPPSGGWKSKMTISYVYVKKMTKDCNENTLYWILLYFFTFLGLATRLCYISRPYAVIWDEAHFGKFASWYLNRTYFFDVHPPGGKLLIAFFGYISGYNGTFSFKEPGISYEGYDEIIKIRICCAIFGTLTVPLMYSTVWNLSRSLASSGLAALFCIFEIGTLLLSKCILLDPLLFTTMMASFHGMILFHNQRDKPYRLKWWLTLIYTGFSLGCVISVKFVGVFIILVVGLYTACDLWRLYSDMNLSLFAVFRHLVTRGLCLILLPALFYIGIFFIHDQVLNSAISPALNRGDLGVGGFSPKFQMRLINSTLYNRTQPKFLTYGSTIYLKIDNLGGGYLHSHKYIYPNKYVSGNLQQITNMRGRDFNNLFRVLFPLDDPENEGGYYGGPTERVLDNNWVRLHHVYTNVTLAVAPKTKALMATKLNLIYGRPYNLTDPDIVMNTPEIDETQNPQIDFQYDMWYIKVNNPTKEDQPVEGFETRFQLINGKIKCALTSTKEKLPSAWGYGQGEMGCTKNMQDPNSVWIVEEINNPTDTNTRTYVSDISFVDRLIETHQVMTWVNARLKPEGFDPYGHYPWHWPILYKIQPWYDILYRVVLMGNPLIFFINLLSLLGSPMFLLWNFFRKRRLTSYKQDIQEVNRRERRIFAINWLLVAYLFHYVPFMFMNRILYLHHYFPALQFSSMLSSIVIVDCIKSVSKYLFRPSFRDTIYKIVLAIVIVLLTVSFSLYVYAVYGIDSDGHFHPHNSTLRHLRIYDWWEI